MREVDYEHPQCGALLLPDSDLGAKYSGKMFTNNLIAAGIVTVTLIPQSLTSRFLEESE